MPRPAADLPFEVISRLAKIAQPDVGGIDRVQPRHCVGETEIDAATLLRCETGQRAIGEYATLKTLHEVKGGSEDTIVLAQDQRVGNRHIGLPKCPDDAELALDGMCPGKMCPAGFLRSTRRRSPKSTK